MLKILILAVAAGFGPAPEVGVWLPQVRSWVAENMIDPGSIGSAPMTGIQPYESSDFGKVWATCAWINAKNRLGGYTGRRGYLFAFRGRALVGVLDGNLGDMECSQFDRLEKVDVPL